MSTGAHPPDLATLLGLEHAVWAALVAGDAAADVSMLAADFVGVYPTGVTGRDEHGAQLADGPTVAGYALTEARVIAVADGAGLLVYRASYRRPGRDVDEQMYVSSLWCHRGGRWVNTFSQDTPVGGPVV